MTLSNGNIFRVILYWSIVRGIHRSPVNSLQKGQWRGALMFSLIYAWINGWVNNDEDGALRRHRTHYDVTVMTRWQYGGCRHSPANITVKSKWAQWYLNSPASPSIAQPFVHVQIKENTKASRLQPVWGPVTRKMSQFDDVIMKYGI